MMENIKEFSIEEISKHNSREDFWTIIDNKVYDLTKWYSIHPGGDLIIQGAGRDCSGLFFSSHPIKVENLLPKYFIGNLKKEENSNYNFHSEFYLNLKKR